MKLELDSLTYQYRCKTCNSDLTIENVTCKKCSHKIAKIVTGDSSEKFSAYCPSCEEEITRSRLPKKCNYCGDNNVGWWDRAIKTWVEVGSKFESFAEDYAYRYKCKACKTDVTISYLKCEFCGLVHGNIETNYPYQSHKTFCTNCQNQLKETPLPSTCNACNGENLSWIKKDDNVWYQPDLSVTPDTSKGAIWITGDFTGSYTGNLEELENDKKITYDIAMKNGYLNNVMRISGPPVKLGDDEPMPIREAFVTTEIDSEYFPETVKINIFDFRLHHPAKVVTKQIDSASVAVIISGKAYGYIKNDDEPDKLTLPKAPITTKDSTSTSGEKPTYSHKTETPSDTARPKSKGAESSCFVCHLVTRIITSLFLWMGCGFKIAAINFLIMSLSCWFDEWASKNGNKIESGVSRFFFAVFLILMSISGIFSYSHYIQTLCDQAPIWPIILVSISLILTGLTYSCFLRTVLASLWLIGLLLVCGNEPSACKNNNTNTIQSIQNSLDHMTDTVNNITPDPESLMINQASTEVDDGKLVTLDETTAQPQLLDSCKNDLYLPSTTMFNFDQYDIQPSAEGNLRQLIEIIKKIPLKKIIITGYTDKSGDNTIEGFTHNIELSELRASSVADWLIHNGNIDPSIIEARGAGSKFPITQIAGKQSLNRRVEIKLACNATN